MEAYKKTTDGQFLLEYLIYFAVWMFLYRLLLFRCLDGRTLAESRAVLLGIVIICNVWGIRFQWESRRRTRDILTTQAIAFGLYTALSYLTLRPFLVRVVLAVTMVLAMWCAVMMQN